MRSWPGQRKASSADLGTGKLAHDFYSEPEDSRWLAVSPAFRLSEKGHLIVHEIPRFAGGGIGRGDAVAVSNAQRFGEGSPCAGNSVDSGPFYPAINTTPHGPDPIGPEEGGGKGDRENRPAAPARILPSHYLSVLAVAILE